MAIPQRPIRKRAVRGEGRPRGASIDPRSARELEGPSFPGGFVYDPEEETYDLAWGPRDMRRGSTYQGGVATGTPMSEAEWQETRQQSR